MSVSLPWTAADLPPLRPPVFLPDPAPVAGASTRPDDLADDFFGVSCPELNDFPLTRSQRATTKAWQRLRRFQPLTV